MRRLTFAMGMGALAVLMGVSSGRAATLNVSLVRPLSEFQSAYQGITYDPVSERFYQIENYYQANVYAYANQAAFNADAGAILVNPIGGMVGTYFSANGGFLYGHDSAGPDSVNSSTVGKWNLATGALVASASPSGFYGQNFTDTYSWGGLSSMNVEQDATGMYLVSGSRPTNTGGDFTISIGKLGTDLSVTSAHTVNLTANGFGFGFGFTIDGQYFGGSNHKSPNLDYKVNASTGAITANAVSIIGLGPNLYIDNATYIASSDTLYIYSAGAGGGFYEATNVSAALGLGSVSAVPLPASLPMFGAALLALSGVGYGLNRRAAPREKTATAA